MKVRFKSIKLEKILSDDRLIKKHYSKIFQSIKNRLTEFQSVSNLSLISHNPPPRKHRLSGNLDGYWSVDVSKNYRLLFTTEQNEAIDESQIDEIIIVDISDIH